MRLSRRAWGGGGICGMSVQRAQGARGPLPVAAAPLRSHVSRGSAGWLLEQGGALSLSLSLSVVSRSLSVSLSLRWESQGPPGMSNN